MKVSIASYAFHGLLSSGKIDLFGYLESCRYRYHLASADIWNGMLVATDDDYLTKVKEALVERDLLLANLCVDQAHIWEDDAEKRGEHYQTALAHLRAAEILGAKTIRIDAGGRDEVWSDEQFDLIVRRYREYAQRAYDNGYRVGPENHWGTEVDPDNMIKLCRAVDHPGFGVLLHFRASTGDAQIARYAMHTHVSWQITEGPLEKSMAILRDTGYDGYWGVEHHTGENEYAEVSIQLAKVRAVLAGWRVSD